MEHRRIKTFITVATLLNFNRAADVLNCAQSTVSAQIRSLEEEFGVPLFDRLGKRVVLTEAGQVFLRYAGKMQSLRDETFAQVSGASASQGLLTVRAPQSVATRYLPEVIRRFGERFPQVNLDISTCAFHNLRQELGSGIVDVAFLLSDTFVARELNGEMMQTESLGLFVGAGHALAGREAVKLTDLAGETLILPKHDCSYRMGFERSLSEAGVRPGRIVEYNSVSGIVASLGLGLGVALLPEMAVAGFPEHGLVRLPWEEEPLETCLLMIWHRGKWVSPAVKHFMAVARGVVDEGVREEGKPAGDGRPEEQGVLAG